MRGRCAEALGWVAATTSNGRASPRVVIALADVLGDPAARRGEQDTSMPDRDLDRVLQFLLSTGYLAADRTSGGGCARWRYLRLLPLGMVAAGAWPEPAMRARLPTGCTAWDGRDAPVLGYVAATGPLPVVACAPTNGSPYAGDDLFEGLPVTRVDGYWSLLALRDAGLVGGADRGPAGWRDVSATAAGRELARHFG